MLSVAKLWHIGLGKVKAWRTINAVLGRSCPILFGSLPMRDGNDYVGADTQVYPYKVSTPHRSHPCTAARRPRPL